MGWSSLVSSTTEIIVPFHVQVLKTIVGVASCNSNVRTKWMRSRPFHEADLWSVAVYLARSKYMVIPEGWETCHYFSRFCFPTNSVDNCLLPHILLLLVKPCKPCRGRCIERTEAPLDPLFTWPMRCAWRFHTSNYFHMGCRTWTHGLDWDKLATMGLFISHMFCFL
jgi:hypothetical protein